MSSGKIKNIVFDIGNVMVRWSPAEIARLTFGEGKQSQEKAETIFRSDTWLALNRGELTESEAKVDIMALSGISKAEVDALFYYIKETQILLFGSLALLKDAKSAGYKVFALTDNVHEIVSHLQTRFDFWPLFNGAIVSAEEGCLKPGADIFNRLVTKYDVSPEESVFLDDVQANVDGAKSVGFEAIVFVNASQAREALSTLGVVL
ncbi:HAD family hydrolase [Enterovibrio nigricans]|uniref:Putative hydrolase of the HAD superfamily n=1 Tax=Enterovibrio nigricans DSM 22720 TaxID=1121868 RepID=A0A1T4V0N8_9GAMM|nr:HAD family phosphatase [Enterovibrio nigricans]SKA58464.1 putative hydrolase of the HAD superfamily [Enterovibrio nigricans DSM 22720]